MNSNPLHSQTGGPNADQHASDSKSLELVNPETDVISSRKGLPTSGNASAVPSLTSYCAWAPEKTGQMDSSSMLNNSVRNMIFEILPEDATLYDIAYSSNRSQLAVVHSSGFKGRTVSKLTFVDLRDNTVLTKWLVGAEDELESGKPLEIFAHSATFWRQNNVIVGDDAGKLRIYDLDEDKEQQGPEVFWKCHQVIDAGILGGRGDADSGVIFDIELLNEEYLAFVWNASGKVSSSGKTSRGSHTMHVVKIKAQTQPLRLANADENSSVVTKTFNHEEPDDVFSDDEEQRDSYLGNSKRHSPKIKFKAKKRWTKLRTMTKTGWVKSGMKHENAINEDEIEVTGLREQVSHLSGSDSFAGLESAHFTLNPDSTLLAFVSDFQLVLLPFSSIGGESEPQIVVQKDLVTLTEEVYFVKWLNDDLLMAVTENETVILDASTAFDDDIVGKQHGAEIAANLEDYGLEEEVRSS
ncbi:hypothetical protein TrST_g306 [Triparma strigata]|uniref:Uncharacterized protein n=1 Tax=Triparma strigata TaxID=1606541 RepID=A0A9W6ZJM0_9STRA|nr:hypothetical protein TrST_g306 [Triparma strigata]